MQNTANNANSRCKVRRHINDSFRAHSYGSPTVIDKNTGEDIVKFIWQARYYEKLMNLYKDKGLEFFLKSCEKAKIDFEKIEKHQKRWAETIHKFKTDPKYRHIQKEDYPEKPYKSFQRVAEKIDILDFIINIK